MEQPQRQEGRHGEIMLEEGVYEFYKPLDPNTKIEVEIVFMHGLQLGDFKNAYWKTWLTRDRSEVWPKTWLGNDYPNARILSLCYDSSMWKTSTTGNMDSDQLSNKILQVMVMPNVGIGQNDCPVIFVCHSLGGLIAKEILMKALVSKDGMVKKMFSNVKGIFFYATPHLGSMLAGSLVVYWIKWMKSMSPMVDYLQVLNMKSSSLHQLFIKTFAFKIGREWKIYDAAEGSMTRGWKIFKTWVVEDASAKFVESKFVKVHGSDHKTVCKPKRKEDQGYQHLKRCIDTVIADYIRKCADRIVEVPSKLFGNVDRRLEAIRASLKEPASIVGLFGMGGIGKSTLSKVFYNSELKINKYEKYVYLDKVASKTIKDVQLELYQGLFPYMDWKEVTHEDQLVQIRECLSTKEVLLVIDDVEAHKQIFQKLQIEDPRIEKIKVIVTCRDLTVLQRDRMDSKFAISIVKVEGINDDERSDWELFCHHAFHGTEKKLKDMLQEVANDIVRYCQGLPLSLDVIGKYLHVVNKNIIENESIESNFMETWKEASRRLQEARSLEGVDTREDVLWSCLQISFDSLDVIEKNIFLAFACLFSKVSKLDKRTIGAICNSPIGIENLIQRSLLTERDDGCLSIHNQLRDMGRRIVKDRHEYNILWQEKEILQFLEDNERSTTLTGLSLVGEREGVGPVVDTFSEISHTAEDAMNSKSYSELKLLHLCGLNKPHVVDYCLFKSSKEKLVWFRLDYSMITIKGLQRMWSLKGLRVLQILRCDELKEIPSSLGELIELVELEIMECPKVESLPDAFGNLSQLRRLKLDNCQRLLAIPTSVGQLPKLEYLSLVNCRSLKSLCNFESSMLSLRELYIRKNKLLESITGLRNMSNLQILSLRDCELLKKCELELLGVKSKLKKLNLRGCLGLKNEVADALERLDTKHLTVLKLPIFLNECLPPCHELRVLSLENGLGSNELPNELFTNMLKLEKLYLFFEKSDFEDLPGSLWNLKTLKTLVLWGLGKLRELNSESIKSLSQLQNLDIGLCESLERLPVSLEHLPQLSYLQVYKCYNVQWEESQLVKLRSRPGCTLQLSPPPVGYNEAGVKL